MVLRNPKRIPPLMAGVGAAGLATFYLYQQSDSSISSQTDGRVHALSHPIFREPAYHFDIIKKYYPGYVAGRGRRNELVYYEECGKIDHDALLKNGVTLPILLQHYVMTTIASFELEAKEGQRMITVFDVKGTGLHFLQGGKVEFMKAASKIMQMEYSKKYDYRFAEKNQVVIMVNVAGFLTAGWRFVSKLLSRNTVEKTIILSEADTYEGLLKWIDHDNIPKRYGGGMGGEGMKDCRFTSVDEIKLRDFVMEQGDNRERQKRPV